MTLLGGGVMSRFAGLSDHSVCTVLVCSSALAVLTSNQISGRCVSFMGPIYCPVFVMFIVRSFVTGSLCLALCSLPPVPVHFGLFCRQCQCFGLLPEFCFSPLFPSSFPVFEDFSPLQSLRCQGPDCRPETLCYHPALSCSLENSK